MGELDVALSGNSINFMRFREELPHLLVIGEHRENELKNNL